jgi:hypothetical protein
MGLRDEAEQMSVVVETPGAAVLNDLESRFVVPVEQLLPDFAGGDLVGSSNASDPNH